MKFNGTKCSRYLGANNKDFSNVTRVHRLETSEEEINLDILVLDR